MSFWDQPRVVTKVGGGATVAMTYLIFILSLRKKEKENKKFPQQD